MSRELTPSIRIAGVEYLFFTTPWRNARSVGYDQTVPRQLVIRLWKCTKGLFGLSYHRGVVNGRGKGQQI